MSYWHPIIDPAPHEPVPVSGRFWRGCLVGVALSLPVWVGIIYAIDRFVVGR